MKLTPSQRSALISIHKGGQGNCPHSTKLALQRKGLIEYRWDQRKWFMKPAGLEELAILSRLRLLNSQGNGRNPKNRHSSIRRSDDAEA